MTNSHGVRYPVTSPCGPWAPFSGVIAQVSPPSIRLLGSNAVGPSTNRTQSCLHMRTIAAVTLLAVLGIPGAFQASVIVIGPPRPSSVTYFFDTVGYAFTVGGNSLRVTELGVYDSGGDGLQSENVVGLWDETRALLSSATFAAGTAASFDADFRWAPVASFDLLAGHTYRIGAFSRTGENRTSGPALNEWASISGDVTLVGAVRSNNYAALAYPHQAPYAGEADVGPNVRYSVITPEPPPAVPDAPATLLLCCGALGVLVAGRRLVPRPPE
jgi:hypothetical protein